MRRAAVAAALALAGLAGCGTPSADLLVIERAGDLPDARVTLVVGDGGTVECDGTEQTLPNDLLLDARDLTDDLEPILARNARLPAPPAAILRYRVTGGAGGVRFADASPRLPRELGRLIRFTRAVATRSCGLDR
jgi:hypothetical protein